MECRGNVLGNSNIVPLTRQSHICIETEAACFDWDTHTYTDIHRQTHTVPCTYEFLFKNEMKQLQDLD